MSDALDSIDPTAERFLRALAAGYRRKQARLAEKIDIATAERRREIDRAAENHQSASDKGWQARHALVIRERAAGEFADALEEVLAQEGILCR